MSEQNESPKKDDDVTVDMYHVKNRWSAVLFVAFIVAFLIFAVAVFLYPQMV